jgi:hypothetical protein
MWSFTGRFNLNRFANPQGYARWTTSMNIGLQRKFFSKKLITINAIDPFVQQKTGHILMVLILIWKVSVPHKQEITD